MKRTMNSTVTDATARLAPASNLHSFEVEIAGCRIRATCCGSDAERALARSIFPTVERSRDRARPDLFVRVEQAEDRFRLFFGDDLMSTPATVATLEAQIVRVLDDAIVERLRGWWAIHAGVVAWGSHALVLPGSTHSGKSTLVADLVKLGATYYSDEYAMIDSEGKVHAYPRPMLLRNGKPHAVVTPTRSAGTTPAVVRWILALHYEPGCQWKLTSIDQSEAMMILLRSTPHVLSGTPDLVLPFERAVTGAQSFVGRRPEAAHAAREILRLIT